MHAIRDLCVEQPNKFKFHFISDNDAVPVYDGVLSASEENKRPYVPKQNCYTLDIPNQSAPEQMKYMPLTIESVVSTHQKVPMKRYGCDFYKPSGFSKELEAIPIKEEKRQKNKFYLQFIAMCLGDSIEVEYKHLEEGQEYMQRTTLQSG